MAKLTNLPDPEIIRSFKGLVDFYTWKGIPVARKWPQHSPRPATPNEAQQQQWLQIANQLFAALSTRFYNAIRQQPSGTSLTPRDLFMRHYFGTALPGSGYVRDSDPHARPFPIPDPNPHYIAILDFRVEYTSPSNCVLRLKLSKSASAFARFYDKPPVPFTADELFQGRTLRRGYYYALARNTHTTVVAMTPATDSPTLSFSYLNPSFAGHNFFDIYFAAPLEPNPFAPSTSPTWYFPFDYFAPGGFPLPGANVFWNPGPVLSTSFATTPLIASDQSFPLLRASYPPT